MVRRYVLPALAVAWLVGVALAGLHHHHPWTDDATVPLPIQKAETIGFSAATRLVVECATDVTVTVGKDHGGSALPEVTVYGRPKVGRCHPEVLSPLTPAFDPRTDATPPTSPAQFVDGATSQVVHVTHGR